MAPSRPYNVVEATIKEEFGKSIEELFLTFDPVPIAAASVAYLFLFIFDLRLFL